RGARRHHAGPDGAVPTDPRLQLPDADRGAVSLWRLDAPDGRHHRGLRPQRRDRPRRRPRPRAVVEARHGGTGQRMGCVCAKPGVIFFATLVRRWYVVAFLVGYFAASVPERGWKASLRFALIASAVAFAA